VKAAIDIGGTFTDVLLYDDQRRELWMAKVHSTPDDPARAFIEGLRLSLKNANAHIEDVDAIIHGTTIVTNSLLEGNTARVGLLVTQGFRDLLEIGRQVRPKLYDLFADRLPPLVPRHRVLEVNERVDARGQVVIPLDEEQAVAQIEALTGMGVETLAIVLLFSFLDPSHEKRLNEIARKHFPEELIFLSGQISPEFREYERASTTIVAAAVAPSVVTYLNSIDKELEARGWNQEAFSLMHSGGGLLPANQTVKRPHSLIESGPAAGVIATVELARELDLERVIAFDMGGTTAKASLILNGQPQYTSEYEVGGEMHRAGRALGSGYPVRFPMIDIAECGAGAGSLAWIDQGGHLRVGPQSAGADPGPACYAHGGTRPTITDAYLALGLLAPDGFLGGKMLLEADLAARAIETHIAKPLNMGLQEAASGILEIANANMLRILRLVSIERGHDPRNFSLVAYGGAGPLHASTLAEQMSMRQVIIPRYPALFSAFGLLFANPSADFSQTVMLTLDSKNIQHIKSVQTKLKSRANDWFKQTEVPESDRQLQALADLRYLRQNYELTIELPHEELESEHLEHLYEKFHTAHKQAFGHSTPGETIQVVNLRLRSIDKHDKPEPQPIESVKETAELIPHGGQQEVWVKGKWQTHNLYQRADLYAGHHLKGPLIVQEKEATILVEVGWELTVDHWGNLLLNTK
jgi:N-methylhydantoinase A